MLEVGWYVQRLTVCALPARDALPTRDVSSFDSPADKGAR